MSDIVINYIENTPNKIKYHQASWDEYIRIYYVIQGNASFYVNGALYTLNNDNVFIINSNTVYSIVDKKDTIYYEILFSKEYIAGIDNNILAIFDSLKFKAILLSNTNTILNLIDNYNKDIKYKDLYIKNMVSTLFYEAIANSNDNNIANNNETRIKNILSYIYENYNTKINIDDICNHIDLCRSEVCRIFKLEINESIADYILKYRIEKSIPLLLEGIMPVSELATKMGFNSSSYYAEAFKKVLNVTPLEYKKNNR